jgi:NAD(P)-dependent dehydrogenase (short-subunit alcohol dehydrogenase family)
MPTQRSSARLSILITGATAGIGRMAALHLARHGHQVFATGRSRAALDTLGAEAGDLELHPLTLDVTRPESIDAARAEVDRLTEGRGLDVLVNNAGYAVPGPLAELSDRNLRAQFDTNVFGLMAVTRAFLPAMIERGQGRILNVSSVSGRTPAPLLGAYHASKYALEALSDSLRMELHPFGIRVVLIEPGTIQTEFAERSAQEIGAARTPDTLYGPVYDRADDLRRGFEKVAVGPACVVDTIERAILARRPRARYVTPARFYLAIVATKIFPTWLVDWVSRRTVGLTPEVLGRLPRP